MEKHYTYDENQPWVVLSQPDHTLKPYHIEPLAVWQYKGPGPANWRLVFTGKNADEAWAKLYELCGELDKKQDNSTDDEQPYSPERERAKMTQALRYEIIKRDGYKCVVCGRTVYDGIKLHVDHIHPVSKGGRTTRENLRTLCNECNQGKAAREA
jgi:hypothetical protein